MFIDITTIKEVLNTPITIEKIVIQCPNAVQTVTYPKPTVVIDIMINHIAFS